MSRESNFNIPDLVPQVTTDLLNGKEPWKTKNIVGVGFLNEEGGKISVLTLQKQDPPDLKDYFDGLGLPPTSWVTRLTGPFQFTEASGAAILSEGVSGFGNLTAVVQDESSSKQFLLSCHHVLGPIACTIYDWTTQMQIGTTEQVVPWQTDPIPADAALAAPVPGLALDSSFPNFPTLIKDPVEMKHLDNVEHFGVVTHGKSTVQEENVTLKVNIHGVPRNFANLALVDPEFANKGDSGSLVVNTDDNKPTGIVFAKGVFEDALGAQTPKAVAVCSLIEALKAFGVKLA